MLIYRLPCAEFYWGWNSAPLLLTIFWKPESGARERGFNYLVVLDDFSEDNAAVGFNLYLCVLLIATLIGDFLDEFERLDSKNAKL